MSANSKPHDAGGRDDTFSLKSQQKKYDVPIIHCEAPIIERPLTGGAHTRYILQLTGALLRSVMCESETIQHYLLRNVTSETIQHYLGKRNLPLPPHEVHVHACLYLSNAWGNPFALT